MIRNLQHNVIFPNIYPRILPGSVGIVLGSDVFLPATQSRADVEATERARDFTIGWFAEPLLGSGDYPSAMTQGTGTRLPQFTAEEITQNSGMQNKPNSHYKQCITNTRATMYVYRRNLNTNGLTCQC